MATAFIVRPFGTQRTRIKRDKEEVEVNFDWVEKELIDPALVASKITGRTTGEIVEAGNIRDDMFQLLLTRDLVVADVSIQNANVFYELGVRHALRDRWTVMIRCKGDPMPFDNLTDRYFEYDAANPGAGVEGLKEVIRQTLEGTRGDSPIFRSIPNLKAQDPALFITIPSDFGQEVEIAKHTRRVGDLELLASEVESLSWEIPGLRPIGRALFELKAWEQAREVWESVTKLHPDDPEANEWLGTIYQRLAESTTSEERRISYLTRSNQVLQIVLAVKDLKERKRAEIHSLIGRNDKSKWLDQWKMAPDRKAELALGSAFLRDSFDAYNEGFHVDLNHYYSGLNAAAMLVVLTSLAEMMPSEWEGMWTSEKEASRELDDLKERLAGLLPAVRLSLEAEKKRLAAEKREDVWLDVSWADYNLLTLKAKPKAIERFYRDALPAEAPDFARESAARQIQIYRDLGLMTENVAAALTGIGPLNKAGVPDLPPRTILFTGHRIDAPGRRSPRFPASKEAEARAAIAAAVDHEIDEARKHGQAVVGIAGGASGGDIIFHEICRERGISSTLYLAMTREDFIVASVADAGEGWISRFHELANDSKTRMLGSSKELPPWLHRKPNYSIWDRSNLWMLGNALVDGGKNAALIALWDGSTGDGSGGTEHMVRSAKERGARVIVLDTHTLFGT